jgi:DNA-binding winged helix-turn-helix (wHTH) protein/tetratricopeptide (TPR) repeat protein
VLSFLASNSGSVVTKQQLLDTLWNGSIVNDPALTRCISQIRQALGDDPKQPRFIETVPKIGYRLVAPISSPSHNLSRTRQVRWVAAAVVAAVVIAVVASQNREALPPEKYSVDVRTIENGSEGTDSDVMAHILGSEIAENLSQIDGLKIIEPQSVLVADTDGNSADYRLEGRLEDQDGHVIFFSWLVENRSEDSLWSKEYELHDADLFTVREDIVNQVTQALNVDVPASLHKQLAFRPTQNFLAYDAYIRGREYYIEYDYIHNENAITMFEQAIELDPDFGLAHARLSDALSQQSIFWKGQRLEEAQDAADRAIELEPSRAEAYKALGLVLHARGDGDGAFDAYQYALELDPDAWEATYNIATIMLERSELREAESFYLRTLRIVPTHEAALARLGAVYMRLGDIDQAELWLDRALENSPLRPGTIASRATLDVLNGKTKAASSRCEKVLVVFNNNYNCLRLVATSQLMEGELASSRRWFNLMNLKWPNDGYAMLGQAQVLLADGKIMPALNLVNRVIGKSTQDIATGSDMWSDYWVLAAAYSLKGDEDDAFQSLEDAVQAGHRFYLWDTVEPAFSGLHGDQRFDDYLAMMKRGENYELGIRN